MAGVPRLPGAYQPFEEEAHVGPVVDRATFLPIGQYEDGSLAFAWPGFLKDAWEGGQRTYLDAGNVPVPDAAPGTRWSSNVDALNAASIAPMAGVAGRVSGAIPRGALGSGGSDMVTKPKGITAYHGSPHDFDKFDMSRIGTGEGAQAYGHGLYFAENEGVARIYRDKLSAAAFKTDANAAALNYLKSAGGDVGKAIAESNAWIDQLAKAGARRSPKLSERLDMEIAANDLLKRQSSGAPVINENPGRMYEVRINAEPEQFLDWDKPLSQQPQEIRNAFERMFESNGVPRGVREIASKNTLGDALETLGFNRASAPDVSATLKGQGIPGIRYLDQGSRNAGEGTYNYVVFDDALIDIMRKYANAETAGLPYLISSSQENEQLPAWRPMD